MAPWIEYGKQMYVNEGEWSKGNEYLRIVQGAALAHA